MDSGDQECNLSKGQLLVSEPSLADPNFRCTVVLVTEHDEKGAFGLTINRPGGQTVADLWEGLTGDPCVCSAPVFIGGPVEQAAVFILHNREDLRDGSEPIIDGLYMGSSLELLQALIEDEVSAIWEGQQIYRVFCGYSGWGAGQLDGELAAGGWFEHGLERAAQRRRVDKPGERWSDRPATGYETQPPLPQIAHQ